jgi:hypothetical protein
VVVSIACTSSPASTPTATPSSAAIQIPTPTSDAGLVPAVTVVLATTDLAVGNNRVAFAILDDGGLVMPEEVYASFFREGSQEEFKTESRATFRQWPSGRGLYTVQAQFDSPGAWRLEVDSAIDDRVARGGARFQVNRESGSPALGDVAPSSLSKTLQDVERIEELTTDAMPDEELYSMTIAEALEAGKPLVVTFATPAFCRTATCGPQVDVLKEVKAQYPERVSFIHVEVFDNPLEMRDDFAKARVSPVFEEWGLKTEPFTFVIDSPGSVSAKFEGFVTTEELSEAIEKILA